MADHAELQILKAIKSAIETGTGGYRVHLNRTRPFGDRDQLPAIVLHYGDDEVELQNAQFIDSTLQIDVELIDERVDSAKDGLGEWMSRARRDIHARLRADRTLGLSIVQDTLPAGASEPELDDQLARPVIRRRISWRVKYRTSVDDSTQL